MGQKYVYMATPRTWADGELTTPLTDANGRQVVNVNSIAAGDTNIGNVDVLTIAAGDNNIGNVDVLTIAAGDNNIGNVDVLSVVPGTGATSLGKAEDAVHASGDSGVMALAVRTDTAAALAGTDGDYAPLELDANGRLHVIDSANPGSYTTPTHTAVTVGVATGEALASNANRLYALLINDSDTVIYMKLGASATLNAGIRLNANGGSYELSKKLGNLYTGAINAISSAASKNLIVTEGV